MKLLELFEGVKCKKINFIDKDVENLSCDSRRVFSGDLFFCLSGETVDGREYAFDAINGGAVAVVVEKEIENLDCCQIIVENARLSMTELAQKFYNFPSKKLKIIGVTGTNGKTTITYMLSSVLKTAGKNCGVIGTLGIAYGEKLIAPELTTPDPIYLNKIFADMVKQNVEYVIMEVSAHAIYFDKIEGIDFICGIFTNCTQDHLDFFKDMETYKNVKAKFFTEKYCKHAILNFDDNLSLKISKKIINYTSYGLNNPSDVFAVDIQEKLHKSEFVINIKDQIFDMSLNLTGTHNIYNALAVSACANYLNIPIETIALGLKKLDKIEGRLEFIAKYNNADIFIDFAHTPDGLEKSISALLPHCNGKLYCVFGCGGNRDKEKRKIMGKIASELCDFCIITSDNPRFEDEVEIINQIEQGFNTNSEYLCIPNRERAIKVALNMIGMGDILLIAGKGAENYQEIMGVKYSFNDKAVVKKIIAGV